MDAVDDDELQILRRRAYGPSADIHLDSVAGDRLAELESRGRPQGFPVVEMTAPAPTGDRPPVAGGHVLAEEPDDGSTGWEPPLRRGARAALAGLARVGRATWSRLFRMRRSTVLTAVGVLALAATFMVALTLVQRVQPDPLQVGARQVARLSVDSRYEIPMFFTAADHSTPKAFQEFHGLRAVVSEGGVFATSQGELCLSLYSSAGNSNSKSMTISGSLLGGCAVAGFPAMTQFRTDLDGFPEELRSAFPDSTGLQFVYDSGDNEVVVFASQ